MINCLGIAVVDALSGPLSHYPTPRVESQVVTRSIRFAAGGGAVNTASALGRMGLETAVFTKLGHDPNGAFLREELQRCGVNTSGICVSDQETTPFTFVGIHEDGDRTFIHTPGANLTFCPDDLALDTLFSGAVLCYQDLWVLPCMDGQPAAALLAEARRRGMITVLDECWGLGPDRARLECMLPHCDYVLPSVDDLRGLYPNMPPAQIAAHLRTCGAGTVILKMGSEGCLVADESGTTTIPAFTARVVDTTGAGDCWDAGFLAALTQGEPLANAVRIGHACAAFSIEAVGGSTGVPEYARVKERAMSSSATAIRS